MHNLIALALFLGPSWNVPPVLSNFREFCRDVDQHAEVDPLRDAFYRFDVNADGLLVESEANKNVWLLWSEFDSDGDNALSLFELKAGIRGLNIEIPTRLVCQPNGAVSRPNSALRAIGP